MSNYGAGILAAGEALVRRISAAICNERATTPATKGTSQSCSDYFFAMPLLQNHDIRQPDKLLHYSMKMKFTLTVLALLAASGLAAAATNDLTTLLQRGLFEEEANHQLDAAIGDYKEAIEHFDHQRQLAATAIFRLGECYRKLGRTNEAAVQYQRIAREFDDQKELVALSRQNLTGMGMSAAPALSSLPDAARQKQQKLLEEEIKVVEHELQLQQAQYNMGLMPYDGTLSTQQKLLELKRQLAALEGDQAGSSPIIAASATGASPLPPDEEKFLREVKETVENSPDLVNQQLYLAAQKGYVAAAEFLIAHGADPNRSSSLVEAAVAGNDAMVQLLLSHGAAVDSRDNNGTGRTALSYAVQAGFMAVCRTLVAKGADVNAKDKSGSTPLQTAVDGGQRSVAEFLITNKAQIDVRSLNGMTPLLSAIIGGKMEMVELLLDNHADANREIGPLKDSRSPLGWAIESKHAQIVQLLLDHGAKPNAADSNGDTALVNAIKQGNVDMIRILIEHGADVNFLDRQGRPPLARLRSFSTENGPQIPDLPTRAARLGLSSHLRENGPQIEELLIKAGADPDYDRRQGIWTCGVGGTPKTELFQCPTNSINHYTLLEFLATLYEVHVPNEQENLEMRLPNIQGNYSHENALVPFPDFARVSIHRLEGKRAEVLHVNVEDILRAGDGSKGVALQAGDLIEIAKQEHKVADRWYGLSAADVTALNKCLLRTVQVISQGHTNDLALVPSFADAAAAENMHLVLPQMFLDLRTDWCAEVLKGRKSDTVVRSFLLSAVVRDANVLLNTWDLSRVRLTRGGAKMTFDLTANPPPDVWLEDGDVIEIPELGEGAPATEAK
jgi:ankyrin repeat protein